MKLLTVNNTKTLKSQPFGYETFIMHLAPAARSGYNVCPSASVGCMAGCLNTAGRGCYDKTQHARIRRTKLFFESRAEFFALLVAEIYTGIRLAKKHNLTPCFRLNGTSDILWENEIVPHTSENIFHMFPAVQFYDYTKVPGRTVPANYHLTFSRSESNSTECTTEFIRGRNVAVVFAKVPERYNLNSYNLLSSEHQVFVGDGSDLRFLDPVGHIVGLTAKGKAKKDTTGFVVR